MISEKKFENPGCCPLSDQELNQISGGKVETRLDGKKLTLTVSDPMKQYSAGTDVGKEIFDLMTRNGADKSTAARAAGEFMSHLYDDQFQISWTAGQDDYTVE